MFLVRALLLLMVACSGALAQSSPGFIAGKPICANYPDILNCPAPANPFSLNQAFQAKQDFPIQAGEVPGVDGVFVTGTPSLNQILQATSSTSATWQGIGLGANVLYAANYSGATVSDQIAACVAALPALGGVCDARSILSGTLGAATIPQSNYTVLMPCSGSLSVSGTIQLYSPSGVSGANWLGCGGSYTGGTLLTWTGGTTGPLFRIRGVQNSRFANFGVQVNAGAPLSGGAVFQLETATGTVSTHRLFENIYVNGVAGYVPKIVRWCTGDTCGSGGVGGDTNNDLDVFRNFQAVNYSNCAFSIGGTQSVGHTFDPATTFQSNGFGQRGVCTTQETIQSGNFRWYGSAGGGSNAIADFDLGGPNGDIFISGYNLEGSSRLLQTAEIFGIPWAITIEGGRWAADSINVDNNLVVYKGGGPLIFNGNIVSLASPVSVSPSLLMSSASGVSAGKAFGNQIAWGTSAPSNQPFLSNSGHQYWKTDTNIMSDIATTNFYNIPELAPPSPGLLVANLPACSSATQGTRQFVTNQATAVAYHGAVTDGGSTKQNVTCDGTAWYQD